MGFLSFLKVRSAWVYVMLGLLGIINSLMYSGLLVFLNSRISDTPISFWPQYDWVLFVGAILLAYIGNRAFQIQMIKLTVQTTFDFEMLILRKLKNTDLESFEKLGKERVFTAIQDSSMLSHLPEVFMNAFNSITIIVCCIAYLLSVSIIGGLVIALLMFLLLVLYMFRNFRLERELNGLRDLQNGYFRYLNDLLNGFREIKMSIKRNNSIYVDFLKKNRTKAKEISFSTSVKYLENELTGSYSWYLVLGFIIFLLPLLSVAKTADVSAFIITILYLIGPIAILVTMVPNITNIKIALERLRVFNADVETNLNVLYEDEESLSDNEFSAFQSIRFEEVTYSYYDASLQKTFLLGPLNIEIRANETLFAIGGNGSGKSTFLKLFVGLYYPHSGSIYYNNVRIAPDKYSDFRDRMVVVFSDSFLFNENYDGFALGKSNHKLMDLFKTMQFSDSFLRENEGMIRTDLSKGQQKRLSLIYAMLEDKELMVLDEWAAEQDPAFRQYFYTEILKNLKQSGKTLIMATHDDEYYRCADRVIKFNYGKIISDERVVH
jgi:cyclic peptide transporter